MKEPISLIGNRYGKLTVLRLGPKKRASIRWFCQCDCGKETLAHSGSLKSGVTRSCGCLRRENRNNLQHGHSLVAGESKEYNAWIHAKQRCYNPKNKKYQHYGARGIIMCDKWRNDFLAFLADVGPAPEGSTLDRINVDGNYEPGNVRWTTNLIQGRNTRRTRWYGTQI